jgi:hypothetical protein
MDCRAPVRALAMMEDATSVIARRLADEAIHRHAQSEMHHELWTPLRTPTMTELVRTPAIGLVSAPWQLARSAAA